MSEIGAQTFISVSSSRTFMSVSFAYGIYILILVPLVSVFMSVSTYQYLCQYRYISTYVSTVISVFMSVSLVSVFMSVSLVLVLMSVPLYQYLCQ